MRILNVTQSYYPFLDKGGPTVKVRALARGMAAAGHTVTVLTADLGFDPVTRETADATPSRWGWEAHQDGVEAIYLRTHARYRALTWNPGVTGFCRERLASYDLAHIYGLYDLIGPRVASACRRIIRPYVVEPMGMFHPIVRNIWMKRMYHDVFGGAMLHGADRLVATAEQERQELLGGGIPDCKIVVRRNGIDIPPELPPPGSFRTRWEIATNVKLVLFLGRLVSKKSPDLMLEAFARWYRRNNGSQPSLLVLAGPDEGDGFRQHLETFAAQVGLNGGVLFTGPLYGDAKWAAYRDADLFVLPSQNENFGNTAAEAVACGTPVLVTDRCGIAPIVDRRAGLVVSHDCDALGAGLEKILDDPAFAAHLRAGCRDVARSLSWAEPLAQMESLYQGLVSARHQG
jgi:glycosyltransferase involved in cell wall biosynthesis